MGESKIIVIANQKGGAGKSTLCMLLANYLSQQYEVTVGAVIDTDLQKSIVKKRTEDLIKFKGTAVVPFYQVVSYMLANNQQIPEFVRQLRATGSTYIIDTPGSLAQNGIISFLALADFIICPFDFDDLTLSATTEFLLFWNKFKDKVAKESGMEIKARIIMVPCRKPSTTGTNSEKEIWEKVKGTFYRLYEIAPEIPESSAIRRCDTMLITPKQIKVAGNSLDFIANTIYNPNNNNIDESEDN